MRPASLHSRSSSSSSSSGFSFGNEEKITSPSGSSAFFSKLTSTVRDTRSKVEAKKTELNATMQEKLPEWKSRSVMYGNIARETGIEWGRRGKVAVERWKKEPLASPSGSHLEHSVFGMSLSLAVLRTRVDPKDPVPAVFRRCVEYVDSHGVMEVGIYRISGSMSTVNGLRTLFEDGSDVDLEVTQPDPHAVGALLKMYLRELPEPIVPTELAQEYSQVIAEAIRTQEDAAKDTLSLTPALLKTMQTMTATLPRDSFHLLRLLCAHLRRISAQAATNRMTTSNLALIFIPTLGIGRHLFYCMVENPDLWDTPCSESPPAGPALTPPPLPQKPLHIQLNRSDSDSKPLAISTTPPPKPSRSPHHTKKESPFSCSPPDRVWKRTPGSKVNAIGRQFETLMHH
ncbi:Rho GTPase activation protein [Phycomyces nitens]|nr:Rho GTPase activation protein [Phycomyces nitens]